MLFPSPRRPLALTQDDKRVSYGHTICPAPMTPRRFTSCAAKIGLELKHLDCLAVGRSDLRSKGANMISVLDDTDEEADNERRRQKLGG